jgi:hypothetical protein
MSGFLDFFKASYDVNVKYLYYDLYYKRGKIYAVDCGVAKNIHIKGIIFDIKLGLSVQNFFAGKIILDYTSDDIPVICRLSSAFIFRYITGFVQKMP